MEGKWAAVGVSAGARTTTRCGRRVTAWEVRPAPLGQGSQGANPRARRVSARLFRKSLALSVLMRFPSLQSYAACIAVCLCAVSAYAAASQGDKLPPSTLLSLSQSLLCCSLITSDSLSHTEVHLLKPLKVSYSAASIIS